MDRTAEQDPASRGLALFVPKARLMIVGWVGAKRPPPCAPQILATPCSIWLGVIWRLLYNLPPEEK